MHQVLAIDPGNRESGWVYLVNDTVRACGVNDNHVVLAMVQKFVGLVAIERVVSYGMAIGFETIETIEWVGRFQQASEQRVLDEIPYHPRTRLLPRKEIGKHICQDGRAKDPNIRAALLDRYGGKADAIGNKKCPGPLYSVKSHAWQALAVGLTALETPA